MENLEFYNKEGYPYNFQYNNETDKWEGKLLFDPNSNDTFKTIGMYLFEKVDPISLDDNFDFKKFELFNNSGITFKKSTKYELSIENVEKVNDSNVFYSKWIYGKSFHQKFPKGTVVSFIDMDVVGTTDFSSDKYFNVVEVKKDAVMITTQTANDVFNITFNSGKITSHDVIKYPDYESNLETYLNSNLYDDKKLSIINSEKNDGVVSVKEYLNLNRYINDYTLQGVVNDNIRLELELLTGRPLLNMGSFTFDGYEITFSNPFGNNINVGQTIIFETESGEHLFNGYQYTVDEIKKEKTIHSGYQVDFYEEEIDNKTFYYIRIENLSASTLDLNDNIYFTGTSKNSNKDFKILDKKSEDGNLILELQQPIYVEDDKTLTIIKKLKFYEYETMVVSGNPPQYDTKTGICYLTTNKINFSQDLHIPSPSTVDYIQTIKNFVEKYKTELNRYGVDVYFLDDKLFVESLYEFNKKYFEVTLYLENNGTIKNIINPNNTYSVNNITKIHYIITNESLLNEKVNFYESNKLNQLYHEEIEFDLQDDLIDFGFKLTINEKDYYIPFQDNSGTTNTTQETIKDFVEKYKESIQNDGILISTGSTVDNKLYIDTIYPDVNIQKLDVKVNKFSSYNIIYQSENDFLEKPILISGNEIIFSPFTTISSFFNTELATGMVIKVNGSSYHQNNKDYNILGLEEDKIQLSYQGVFFNEDEVDLEIESRQYLRKPRESYEKDIYYRFSWKSIDNKKPDESIFFYDISGEQLEPPKDGIGNPIENLRYIGQKPLFDERQQNVVRLNREPNKKEEHINNPKYQQTIFDSVEFKLPQIDSITNFNYLPKPMEIFLGYNSTDEGVNQNLLKMEKVEYITFSGTTGELDNYFIFDTDGSITFKSNTFDKFTNYGFEAGQPIKIKMEDTSPYNQKIFENHETYEIKTVSKNKIFINLDKTEYEFKYFNSSGKTFNYEITVEPKEFGTISVMGETEIEDERFDINLNNMGINIGKEEEHIFKQSDIDEFGIDYKLLNKKRKEMLMVYPEIYNYIGAYKSVIGAINYFGYNDLQLYEYYKNVDINSPFYKKYFRIYIPDMFDQTVGGWNEYDFVKKRANRERFQKTNLFNLTYKITDEEGNNLHLYSLEEVQIKLQKLKIWLREHILPLATNIVDITGTAQVDSAIYRIHDSSNSVRKMKTDKSSRVINFNYSSTLSFSTNYLFTINFYTVDDFVPDHFEVKVKTFYKESDGLLKPVQYHKLFKTNFDAYNFNIDKEIDPYIYIETVYYDEHGVGIINNQLFNFDEPKHFYLVNNNFIYKYYPRISTEKGYYIIDDDGQTWIVEEYEN